MEEESRQVRVLVAVALVLAAVLIGYNAFFIPDVSAGNYIVTDIASSAEQSTASAPGVPVKLNLNTATADELDNLEGVGPTLAEKILAYRQEHGPYQSLEDLKRVDGVGEKTFEKLKSQLTL